MDEKNMNGINEKKENDSKKITAVLIMIAVLMLSTTGVTYAYFAIGATNTGTITGNSATVATNTLAVTKILPASGTANTGVMVPQYSSNTTNKTNALKMAIDGGCVDANGNIACQVYRIQYQNDSSAAFRLLSTLTLTSTMTNLKWYTLDTDNNVTLTDINEVTDEDYTYPASFTVAYGNGKSITSLGSSILLSVGQYRYWFVVIWIEELGSDQYNVDGNKTFTGTVEIEATDASGNVIEGLTSTFTG